MPTYFHHATHMCSDVDTRSLMGVIDGPENHLVITNKSIISKYNVDNRKHINCWTAKSWEPYTAAGLFDKSSNSIISVVDSHLVRSLSDRDESDKHGKHKFLSKIYKLISTPNECYISFKTGHIEPLANALTTRKSTKKQIIPAEELIIDVIVNVPIHKIAFILTKTIDSKIKLHVSDLSSDDGGLLTHSYVLNKEGAELNAVCITPESTLLTLWSTGELCQAMMSQGEFANIPGKVIISLTSITSKKPAKIIHLSKMHAVVLGMDASDEGSLMVLIDTKFGVINSTKKLKMYREPPLAWLVSEGLVVVEGGSLALVPFTLDQSNISTMFSTKLVTNMKLPQRNDALSEQCCSWPLSKDTTDFETPIPEQAMETICSNASSALAEVIISLNLGSISQNISSNEVICHLIAGRELTMLEEALKVFVNIPEKTLVAALIFYIQLENNNKNLKVINDDAGIADGNNNEPVSPYPEYTRKKINLILCKPFTQSELLKHLRTIDFDNSLKLITHLNYLIASELSLRHKDDDLPSVEQCCTWLSLILDTNYIQLSMTDQLNIHKTVMQCLSTTLCMKNLIDGLLDLQPIITKIVRGKKHPSSETSAPYSLERLILE